MDAEERGGVTNSGKHRDIVAPDAKG